MQNKFNLEKAINIGVILAIMVVTGIIIKRNFFSSNDPIQKIEVGQKFELPDVNWSQNEKTIILATRKDCTHCQASAPFFRQLAEKANELNIKMEVISSDPTEESQNILNEQNIPIQSVHQLSMSKYGFRATPTLLFVDRDGIVKDIWIGRIEDGNSAKVFGKLNSLATGAAAANENSPQSAITSTALKALLDNRKEVLMVDVDSREEFKSLHIANAKNIPNDELQVRAARELPKDKPIVFYGRCPRDSVSSAMQGELTKLGYSNVTYLAGGLNGWKDAGFQIEQSVETQQ
jgi:rhodanese-related sulfurtransferase/peroxiredoxin